MEHSGCGGLACAHGVLEHRGRGPPVHRHRGKGLRRDGQHAWPARGARAGRGRCDNLQRAEPRLAHPRGPRGLHRGAHGARQGPLHAPHRLGHSRRLEAVGGGEPRRRPSRGRGHGGRGAGARGVATGAPRGRHSGANDRIPGDEEERPLIHLPRHAPGRAGRRLRGPHRARGLPPRHHALGGRGAAAPGPPRRPGPGVQGEAVGPLAGRGREAPPRGREGAGLHEAA